VCPVRESSAFDPSIEEQSRLALLINDELPDVFEYSNTRLVGEVP